MSSLVQYQAMVDIRATTEAHTDIADVLLSINGADTVASLHAIGNVIVLKMPRKEGLSVSEISDVKVDKTHDHDLWNSRPWFLNFKSCGHQLKSDKVKQC